MNQIQQENCNDLSQRFSEKNVKHWHNYIVFSLGCYISIIIVDLPFLLFSLDRGLFLKLLSSVLNILKFIYRQTLFFKLEAISGRQFTSEAALWCVSFLIKDLEIWGCRWNSCEEGAWDDLKKGESGWGDSELEENALSWWTRKQPELPGLHPGKKGTNDWNPLLSTGVNQEWSSHLQTENKDETR